MFVNLFRNILLPRQMFPRLRAEETIRETMFPLQCFLICERLKYQLSLKGKFYTTDHCEIQELAV